MLYQKVKDIINQWDLKSAKVIGIVVQEFDEQNIDIAVAYQEWEDYSQIDDKEECWNYACWDADHEEALIDEKNQGEVRQWLEKQGVKRVGYDEEEDCYDENCIYIGNGPNGLTELIGLLKEVVLRLHQDEIIKKKAGRDLPVILTDLEYVWYFIEATKEVNQHELIEDFLQWFEEA